MLEARAKSGCATKAFPDILSGFYTPDEVETGTSFEDFANAKQEVSIEQAVEKATENFKNNNVEDAVYEIEKEEKPYFEFTEEQKKVLKPAQQNFIEKNVNALMSKDMTRYESESFDAFIKNMIPKDFVDYTYNDFKYLSDIVKVVSKDDKFTGEFLTEIDEYYKKMR